MGLALPGLAWGRPVPEREKESRLLAGATSWTRFSKLRSAPALRRNYCTDRFVEAAQIECTEKNHLVRGRRHGSSSFRGEPFGAIYLFNETCVTGYDRPPELRGPRNDRTRGDVDGIMKRWGCNPDGDGARSARRKVASTAWAWPWLSACHRCVKSCRASPVGLSFRRREFGAKECVEDSPGAVFLRLVSPNLVRIGVP